MPKDRNHERRERIETAAMALLLEKGFSGLSMLAIARAAKASNETLYKWYGDKSGLFAALMAQMRPGLETIFDESAAKNPLRTFRAIGPKLYAFFTSQEALALTRAVPQDPGGALPVAYKKMWRTPMYARLGQLFRTMRDEDYIAFGTTAEPVALYMDLLFGDHPIQHLTGILSASSPDAQLVRAEAARARFLVLLHPSNYAGARKSSQATPTSPCPTANLKAWTML